jgi:hypothetical protein
MANPSATTNAIWLATADTTITTRTGAGFISPSSVLEAPDQVYGHIVTDGNTTGELYTGGWKAALIAALPSGASITAVTLRLVGQQQVSGSNQPTTTIGASVGGVDQPGHVVPGFISGTDVTVDVDITADRTWSVATLTATTFGGYIDAGGGGVGNGRNHNYDSFGIIVSYSARIVPRYPIVNFQNPGIL